MKARLLTAALCTLLTLALAARTKVACVGNSITYGYTLPDPSTQSYPAQLQRMLGGGYEVGNFGHSGATLLNHGHNPYMALPEFRQALAFKADIAVIHLGVNDTDPRNWPNYADEFVTDYLSLVDSLRSTNPDMRIIIANLSPLRATHYRFRSGTRDWRQLVRQAIENVAKECDAELIDFDLPLRDRQDLLADGIHPNVEGSRLLARSVCQAITGNYGGLRLPAVYQSGMVLQRHRPLTFRGTADAGSNITLTLDGVSYRSAADNAGRWSVLTAPLATGGPYTLTVSDGRTTISLTDILAGEVWIASGQSNMEFPLASSVGGAEAAKNSTDPMLRLYDMRPVARTDNVRWTSEIIGQVDSLAYFVPSQWQAASADNTPRFSAIAYYFAEQLRKAMPDVPVGIISNAVGGSTTESWIDVNTLEQGMPEDLVNWATNDYLQKWAQQRAVENVGQGHRHPYEPSYLFSSAIRPLGDMAVAGVIWYQGESNAHNTEIHEALFPMLLDSWRRHFNAPELPFIYTQLSGINRPSWPMFRDSQRRMSLELPDVAMAVTMDRGDSLDVHPTDKRPVGERLARQALHRLYGFDTVVPEGPSLEAARLLPDGTVELTFTLADGLTTSDGRQPRVFELAATEGVYKPADAQIINNKIILRNMDIKQPHFVRYAWQPFTRSNVVNGEGLPMSTFKAPIETGLDIEEGMEYGVSAPFAGRFDNRLIAAGGCNFPTADPFAPGAAKKFYSGIYAADTATMQWQRIGSLPQPMAYGASAQLRDGGIVMIGGQGENGGIRNTWVLGTDGTLAELPTLPAAIDNAFAAAIGLKVYVAGGNCDGKPSNKLFVLDLANLKGGWKELRSMPGNARVQPVMAAATDASGETCLYLWGGFAGRYDKNEPTLELGGLKYSPRTNKWTAVAGPTDTAGEPVALGGGCAATLSDGAIAAAGGVNKDVFLAALVNQAPDYLDHPIDWYRFNRNVFVFNPIDETWHIAANESEAARAGAAMIAGPDRDIYIFGGELKPRIRSAATTHFTDL